MTKIESKTFDANFKLYLFLKRITQSRATTNQLEVIIKIVDLKQDDYLIIKDNFISYLDTIKKPSFQNFFNILSFINNSEDINLFKLAVELTFLKISLLEEVKLVNKNLINEQQHDILSLKFDQLSCQTAYSSRVTSVLLASIQLDVIRNKYKDFEKNNLKISEMFMLLFNESVNQSIRVNSGSSFENLIKQKLLTIGIPENRIIQHMYDTNDESLEYDFIFSYQNIRFGISAKKTIRERYKQFRKPLKNSDIQILLQITLGTDLTPQKVNIITKQYNVFLFISPEIYIENSYLQENQRVFSTTKLNLQTLSDIIKKII